jgi:dihydrofolate reductase
VAVHGSGQLSPSLLGLGLVDELRLMIFPVVIVDGKRFFGGPRLRRRPGRERARTRSHR